ncbi:MAG: hypothetical protein ACRBN8_21070 [Nannocystales bacterium]
MTALGCAPSATPRDVETPTESVATAPSAAGEQPLAAEPETTSEPAAAQDDFESPCPGSEGCSHRAAFTERVLVYPTTDGDTPIGRVERSRAPFSQGLPTIANPDAGEGERLRVVCASEAVTTQVWVNPDALRPVTTTFVVATPTADAKTMKPEIGLSLVPGTPLDVQRELDGMLEVSIQVEAVEGKGWIPDSAVGKAYELATEDPRTLPNSKRVDSFPMGGLVMTDKPDGDAFAKLSGPITIQRLGRGKGGRALVAANFVLEERTYAVGWIDEASIPTKSVGIPGGVPAGYGATRPTYAAVPSGAKLRTTGGEVVAMTSAPTKLKCLSGCLGPTPQVELHCIGAFSATVIPPA